MALSSVLGRLPVHGKCVCAFIYLFPRKKAVRMTIAREGTWDRANTCPFKL